VPSFGLAWLPLPLPLLQAAHLMSPVLLLATLLQAAQAPDLVLHLARLQVQAQHRRILLVVQSHQCLCCQGQLERPPLQRLQMHLRL
jgi:hypothetical protein